MILPTLYKRSRTGATTQWTIEAANGATRTIHGQVGGKLTTSEWYKSEMTNEGRSNERNAQAQAEFEAKSQWQKRTEKNYFADIKEIDKLIFRSPMLAHKYGDLMKKGKVKFPVFVSTKLDGFRCVITKDGARSRSNKEWITVPHILKALEPIFNLYPNIVLDGELYADKFSKDFNKICSLVKRTKPSNEDLKDCAESIRFFWYDICDEDLIFSQRYALIEELVNQFQDDIKDAVVKVEEYVANSEKEVREYHTKFLSELYEGTMVRQDWAYEFSRSNSLLKLKDFIDEEFLIVGIEEGGGNKTGLAVKCILKFHDGRHFPSTIKAQFPVLKEIWENRNKYINKKYATCKYFELTPEKENGGGGIPRFSNCDRFRDAPNVD